jgi:hypothetical protein
LGREREDAQPTKVLRGANDRPGYLALTAVASFLTRRKKSSTSLIYSLDNSSRKDASAHGMGEHGSEDGVNKE